MNMELYNNIEFLLKELHKEWDRTGAVKASVFLAPEALPDVEKKIAERIKKRQEELEYDDLTFKKSVRKSKESYVLLRLARKISALRNQAEKNRSGAELSVGFDGEELKLLKMIINEVG